jgi:transcription elongation GreA/GreB family factor
MMGKKPGDELSIHVPGGVRNYEVTKIV